MIPITPSYLFHVRYMKAKSLGVRMTILLIDSDLPLCIDVVKPIISMHLK